MPTVEIVIQISLDPHSDAQSSGISVEAEELVDTISYVSAATVDDVLVAARDALREAVDVCDRRARA